MEEAGGVAGDTVSTTALTSKASEVLRSGSSPIRSSSVQHKPARPAARPAALHPPRSQENFQNIPKAETSVRVHTGAQQRAQHKASPLVFKGQRLQVRNINYQTACFGE